MFVHAQLQVPFGLADQSLLSVPLITHRLAFSVVASYLTRRVLTRWKATRRLLIFYPLISPEESFFKDADHKLVAINL